MSKVMYQSDADRAAADREFDEWVKYLGRSTAALRRKLKAKRYSNTDAATRAAGESALAAAADVKLLVANCRSTGDMPANAADVRRAVDSAIYEYTNLEFGPGTGAGVDGAINTLLHTMLYAMLYCSDTLDDAVDGGGRREILTLDSAGCAGG